MYMYKAVILPRKVILIILSINTQSVKYSLAAQKVSLAINFPQRSLRKIAKLRLDIGTKLVEETVLYRKVRSAAFLSMIKCGQTIVRKVGDSVFCQHFKG